MYMHLFAPVFLYIRMVIGCAIYIIIEENLRNPC